MEDDGGGILGGGRMVKGLIMREHIRKITLQCNARQKDCDCNCGLHWFADLDRCALETEQQGLRFILSDWIGLGLDWDWIGTMLRFEA